MIVCLFFNYSSFKSQIVEKKYDTIQIKEEYESLNGNTRTLNDKKVNIPEVYIDERSKLSILDFEHLQSILENGDGIIYFGFPGCPWCRVLLPNLIQSAEQAKQTLYVYNPQEIRNELSLNENGELIIEKDSNLEYMYLLNYLDEFLPIYKDLGDENIKRLYVPFVIAIKNGKVVGHHNGVLTDYIDPYSPMTNEQSIQLSKIFDDLFEKVFPSDWCIILDDTSC